MSPRSSSGVWSAFPAITFFACLLSGVAHAQGFQRSNQEEKVIVESGAASQVSEEVRSDAQGVMVAVMVKVGDAVKKGQVLGHMELAPSKHQLDLARQTLENKAALRATKALAQAWTATREETEEAVRKRKAEEVRLEWATNMERYHQGNYEVQLEQKKIQWVQYEYTKQQYEARFFRAPVDGVVTDVLVNVGRKIDYATHVFSVGNDDAYIVPVELSGELAGSVAVGTVLPARPVSGGEVVRGMVDAILDNPAKAGDKIIRLLFRRGDFPSDGAKLAGTRFDVLLPPSGKRST